jgi:hypothetical protein
MLDHMARYRLLTAVLLQRAVGATNVENASVQTRAKARLDLRIWRP